MSYEINDRGGNVNYKILDENTIIHDNKEYKAVSQKPIINQDGLNTACSLCDLLPICCDDDRDFELPYCCGYDRDDGRDVVFRLIKR